MQNKFAILDYVQNKDDIPIKNKIIKNSPDKFFDWYIKKFNPYKLERLNIYEIEGFKITMPFTKQDLYNRILFVNKIFEKTEKVLNNYNVTSLIKHMTKEYFNDFYIATGKNLMPFFLVDCFKKVVEITKKDLKNIEVLIISGNNKLINMILDNIYLDVNYITILIDKDKNFDLKNKISDIYYDSGLNISIMQNLRDISSADIIINTSDMLPRYDNFFKSGAVFLDLTNNKDRLISLAIVRSDIFFIDNFKIKHEDQKYNLDIFELGFYIGSKNYFDLINNIYKEYYFNKVFKELKKENVKFVSPVFLN